MMSANCLLISILTDSLKESQERFV